jgi:thiol-disulfide isomerase/thioredoxin
MNTKSKAFSARIAILLATVSFCSQTHTMAQDGWQKVKGKVPEFSMTTMDGKTIEASSLKGKVILLEFWDTHCGPCLQLMPEIETLSEKYKNNPDVAILVVNAGWEKPDPAKAYLHKKNFKFTPTFVTKDQSRGKLKVSTLPATIIIGKDFTYKFKHLGFDEKTEMDIVKTFDEHIQTLLK